ncbi:MAG: cupin domain-containing protein [Candidatus Ancillula sp.]|jgi:quercetin dioxygenase-like cupin family protein|nr:cupin domain-containing protein [Candidatus Ancillula sp.]
MKNKVVTVVVCIVFLAGGLTGGYFWGKSYSQEQAINTDQTQTVTQTEEKVTATKTEKEVLSQGDTSWDGVKYGPYSDGDAELTTLKITVPPNTKLDEHTHPMPNAGYILQGDLTVHKDADGQTLELHKGDVIREMVNQPHYGEAGPNGCVLIVTYAGVDGQELSEAVK